MPWASSSIIAIGVMLAAICLQTRQESWSYPEAVAGALFLVSGAVFPLAVLPAVVQAIGMLTPLTWWIEGVRQSLFPGGLIVDRRDRVAVRDADRTGRSGRRRDRRSPCWSPGAVVTLALDRRLPGERPARQGPRAAGPDHGILTGCRSPGAGAVEEARCGSTRAARARISRRSSARSVRSSISAGCTRSSSLEAPDGFIVQGLVAAGAAGGAWSESVGTQTKETLTFLDDDIARFMEEAVARRGKRRPRRRPTRPATYETAFRVIGRYMDEQKPRDVFFFEQDGAFVVRLLHGRPAGQPPQAGRVHPGRHRRDGRPGPDASPARPRRAGCGEATTGRPDADRASPQAAGGRG